MSKPVSLLKSPGLLWPNKVGNTSGALVALAIRSPGVAGPMRAQHSSQSHLRHQIVLTFICADVSARSTSLIALGVAAAITAGSIGQ